MHSGALESLQSDKNKHLFRASARVCSLFIAVAAGVEEMQDDGDGEQSRTELDSHANMPVVGKNATIRRIQDDLVTSVLLPQTMNQ